MIIKCAICGVYTPENNTKALYGNLVCWECYVDNKGKHRNEEISKDRIEEEGRRGNHYE